MSTVSWDGDTPGGQGDAGQPRDRGQRREPRHDLVLHARGRERLDLLGATAEDERITALEPHDPAASLAVMNEELVDLLLTQGLARDPRRADRLADEVERDEPVVDEDLARPDELERPHRHKPRVARPRTHDRDRHARAFSTTRWK